MSSPALKVLFLFILALVVGLLLISATGINIKKLSDVLDDIISKDIDDLDATAKKEMDKNKVNIDVAAINANHITKTLHMPNEIPPVTINCPGDPLCNAVTVTVSNAPPSYDYIPEGVTINVVIDTIQFSGREGYARIIVSGLYQLDGALITRSGDIPVCNTPFNQTCYEQPAAPANNIVFRVKLDHPKFSARIPFYYDNISAPDGISNEGDASCTPGPAYTNIDNPPPITTLLVNVEGPSANPYHVTIVHTEKTHDREYALFCDSSIDAGASDTFNVQVVSGDYDLFRIFGWGSTAGCVVSLEDILVKKGSTDNEVTLRFPC